MMILHGANPSPFVRKTIAVFEEKGIDYELKAMAPFPKSPELLAISPLGKIPVLEHDGTFIPDSSVIAAYVDRVHPDPSIYPKDAKEFARALFLEEYADTKAIEVIGTIFFQRFIQKQIFKQEPDEAAVAKCMAEDLPPILTYLNAQVPGAGTIFANFSIADAAFGAQLGNLKLSGVAIDPKKYPKLAAYSDALLARPSFVKGLTF